MPSDLHDHLGYWMRMVSNAVSLSFARKVEAEGVTVAEWVFLRMLYDAAAISPAALTGRMGMTKGAISKLADRLVDKQLVERGEMARGQRGQMLALTPGARKLVPRLAALADGNDAEFFETLTPAEQDELRRLLMKIAAVHRLTDIPTD